MAKIEYSRKSPYGTTQKTSFYLGLYVDRPIPADSTDQIVTVNTKYKHRPDLLAYDLYGDTRYWWIFIRRNLDAIRDPIYDFVPGLEIYAPTKQRLQSLIG